MCGMLLASKFGGAREGAEDGRPQGARPQDPPAVGRRLILVEKVGTRREVHTREVHTGGGHDTGGGHGETMPRHEPDV